jgi:MFS family permease
MAALTSNAVYFFAGYELHQPAEVQLGMAAGGGVVYTLGALFGGKMVDRLGQRRVAASMAFTCIPVAFVGMWAVAAHSLWGVLSFLLLMNLTTAPLWPAIESALTRVPGKLRLSTRITVYNLNWSSTGFVAGAIVGSLALWLSWSGVFIIAAVLSLMVWGIIVFFSIPQSEISAGHVEDSPQELERTKAIMAAPQSKTLLHMAWLSNMLSYVASNTVTPVMPTIAVLLGIKSYALATAITSVWALARIAGFLLTTFWTGWHYRIYWMMISFSALVLGTIALLLSPTVLVLVFAQILFGIALAMLYSGSLYYAMHLSHGSGANAGIHEGLIGIGTVLGPGLAAIAGSPDAVAPKAMAIFAILALGGGVMTVMATRARGLTKVDPQSDGHINS